MPFRKPATGHHLCDRQAAAEIRLRARDASPGGSRRAVVQSMDSAHADSRADGTSHGLLGCKA
jgi:hypothetical protein